MRHSVLGAASNYLEVLKPRESILLSFIGICAAVIAGGGFTSPGRLVLVSVGLLAGSSGTNGLTNYLDRNIDARMQRTSHRALPSGRIYPPEKVLPLVTVLVLGALVLAWWMHPFCFWAGLVGVIAAVSWRKRWTCVFPQGMLASCAPVLTGWFAISPTFDWELLLLCLLIAIWVPIHLWSVMVARRDDYARAGIGYFPLNRKTGEVVRLLVVLSLMLYAASITLYFAGGFSWVFLLLVNILGCVLLYTSLRLAISASSQASWRLYRLSAFPYLGLLFLGMCLDVLLGV
ncbi:MAG: protoheme IX farnesyltransferase [Dehalococcoidales bacterium]|nr:MAG: protoheme IX farnesyltransferase [Dehalococcoidales bacterium]